MPIKHTSFPQAGVVTTRNWLTTPDGDQSRAFWCRQWLLQTDKEMDLVGLKSADRWALIALDGSKILCIIVGCEVVGFIACDKPLTHSCYNF